MLSNLPAFMVIAGLLTITPGPDMALVARNALGAGRRAALLTALGITVGLLVWTGAATLGLAAVLAASSFAYTVVKLAGGAYLLYLGVRTLLALRNPALGAEPMGHLPTLGGAPFQQGLLTNLLNPKIAIFFTSFIPQFVTPGPTAALETLLLAVIFTVQGLAWLVAYTFLVTSLGDLFRQPRVRRVLDGLTGLVLIGFGVRLATESR